MTKTLEKEQKNWYLIWRLKKKIISQLKFQVKMCELCNFFTELCNKKSKKRFNLYLLI